jgi:chaperone required for assembly of F1-ATPase
MLLPSRALAVSVAEEWEKQHKTVNLKSMHMTQTLTKAIRVQEDPGLASYMKEEIETILENDQICYREDPSTQNDYKRNLANK